MSGLGSLALEFFLCFLNTEHSMFSVWISSINNQLLAAALQLGWFLGHASGDSSGQTEGCASRLVRLQCPAQSPTLATCVFLCVCFPTLS